MPPPPLKRLTATTDAATIVAAIRADGGCIVEGMYDAATIGAMRDAVLAKATRDADADAEPGSATFGMYSPAPERDTPAAQDAGPTSFVGSNTIRFSSLGKLAPAPFFTMLDNPVYKAVCDAMLLPYCGTYWMNTAQAMLIGPSSRAQPLHHDDSIWPQVSARLASSNAINAPELSIGAMIALDDVDEAVGATRVVPGSHLPGYRAARKRSGGPEESVPAELAAGDALLYTGRTRHAGGANMTKDRVSPPRPPRPPRPRRTVVPRHAC